MRRLYYTILILASSISATDLSEINSLASLYLKKYHRPTTILTFGAFDEQFTSHIAQQHQSVVVVLKKDSNQKTKTYYKKNCIENIILLDKQPTTNDLKILSESEHFDLVLIKNIFSMFPQSDWLNITHSILAMGNDIIISIRNSEELTSIHTELKENHQAEAIKTTSAETTYYIKKEKKLLNRSHWVRLAHTGDRVKKYTIHSTHTQKYIVKHYTQCECKTSWHAGINLFTFKALNGIYPTPLMLHIALQKHIGMKHTDYKIPNLILQGAKIIPIDHDDYRLSHHQNRRVTPQIIEKVFNQLQLPIDTFMNNLIKMRLI